MLSIYPTLELHFTLMEPWQTVQLKRNFVPINSNTSKYQATTTTAVYLTPSKLTPNSYIIVFLHYRCGASQRYFYLEVGRGSITGEGEIWMEAPDAFIAHNMHTTIMK